MLKRTTIIALVALLPLACNSSSDKSKGSDSGMEETPKNLAEAQAKFQGDLDKKPCEILTPELVESTFSVPKAELKQMKIMGCIYSWKNEDEELQATLTLMRAHKSADVAAQWFANATKGMSAEEAKAVVKEATEKAKKDPKVDTKIEKKAADMVGAAAVANTTAVRFEEVDGVGDQARVTARDGTLWVRTGNLTFNVSAYKGPKMPGIKFKKMDPKSIMAQSKKANADWMAKTLDQRKTQATELAQVVLGAL